jgi:hypothetical protein
MDRRYALVQDLRWEFCMLAGSGETISESQALFLMKAAHDEFFSQRRWQRFVSRKFKRGRGVTFDDIEVELCNIPDREFVEWEKEQEEKEKAGESWMSHALLLCCIDLFDYHQDSSNNDIMTC